MKRSLLVLLIPAALTGCSPKTVPVPPTPTQNYDCAFFNFHGVFAHVGVGAHSVPEAAQIAETVRDRLVRKQIIPDNCGVLCELKDTK